MKKLISLILLLLWMILIFNFSAMNGEISHDKSKKIVRSVIENRVVTPTTETTENVVNIDEQLSSEKNELNRKQNEKKIRKLVKKYDEPTRKMAHVLEYFVLILLMMNFILLYAGLDEIHQGFVVGRVGQVKDVLVDSVGIVIGAIVVIVVQWTKRMLKKKYK